jgi:hypothetical protein
MKMVKSLILGSAAGLLAMSGAQAADLPVKAKAVEYVRICSLYGAGFYYIPGTDTCIKLGGYLRVDVAINTNSDDTGNNSGAGGAQNRFTNAYTWRSREDLNIDTRTATEYGVLRTFADLTFTWTDDTYAGNGTGATIYSPVGPAPFGVAPNNANAGAVAYGTVGVYYAFIQFAGFTIGKAISQFSTPWTNYPGNNFDGLVGGGGTVTGVNQFTYTADFGQGVTAAVSVQDQTVYYQAGVNNMTPAGFFGVLGGGPGGPFGTSDYAGTYAPDVVGMIRVDQAWGLAQGSIAAHDNHAAYYGATEITGHPNDVWGWAVQGALSFKNIPTGPGDTVNMQAVYTDGATRYNIQDLAAGQGGNTVYGSSAVAYASVGLGIAPDTVFSALGPNNSQQLIQTWGVRGAYTHNWDAMWNTSVYGAWAQINWSAGARTLLCATPGQGLFAAIGPAGITNCNPNYDIGQLGIITRWTPVKNLTFSADLTYTHLDQKFAGFLVDPSATIGKPAVAYQLRNQDTLLMLLRAQRNW